MRLGCVLSGLISGIKGNDTMVNIDINNKVVLKVDTGKFKSLTGTITLQSASNDKAMAKYSLDHNCFSHALKMLGNPAIVTYDDSRKLIVSIRSP